jgi:uncharacterized membrane protein YfcA
VNSFTAFRIATPGFRKIALGIANSPLQATLLRCLDSEITPVHLEVLAPALTIVLGAYFIRGITGFGSGLVAVPLLALILPLQTAVPLVLVLDLSAALIMSRTARAHVQWREILPLLPTTLLGIIVGAALLIHLPREPLLVALALFTILFGVRYLLNIHSDRPVSRGWSVPAGLSGGLIGALFGTGGPPYVIYLAHRIKGKSQLRATLSGLFMLDGSFRVVAFFVTGLLDTHLLPLLFASVPVMALAIYLGHRVHIGISNRQMLIMVGTLLVISGGALLRKACG